MALPGRGKYFIVASEEPVRQKIFNMRPVMGEMEGKFNIWAAMLQNEYEFQTLTDYSLQLQGMYNDLSQQISRMPNKTALDKMALNQAQGQLQGIVAESKQTNYQIALRQKRLVSDKAKEKAENEFKDVRKKFLAMASEARPPYEDVKKEYEKLSEESAVSNALKAHNQMTKANFKMGPSDKLNKDVADVKRYEQTYSPETAPRPPKKKTKGSTKKKK